MKLLTVSALLCAMVALTTAADEGGSAEAKGLAQTGEHLAEKRYVWYNHYGWRHGGWRHGGWRHGGWRHVGWRHWGWRHGGWRHWGWRHGGWRHWGWRYWGWTRYSNRQYRYFPYQLTWAQAQRFCESKNARLASVRNLGEYQAIQRVIYRATFSYPLTWIGGSDAQQTGYWFWIDGTPFRYANWCQGQPDNAGGREHCLHVNWSANRCMNDIPCYTQLPFVCARKRR